jgi:4-amino-4-deoxy-L-arabinose transferase-like glycosyltransferase
MEAIMNGTGLNADSADQHRFAVCDPRESTKPTCTRVPFSALIHPRSAFGASALISAWCAVLFFYGLGSGELYRTESLRAILAAECLRTGNWIVPTLYGEPLLTKPSGMYAAIALVSWPLGGVNEWSARLPSALAATATVFLFYWYFRRQLGRLGGLVAALILPASFMWLDKASAAEIDMLQTAWVTAAILFFLRALEEEKPVGVAAPLRSGLEGKQEEPIVQSYRVLPGGDVEGRSGSRFQAEARARGAVSVWWLASLLCVCGGFLTKWTAPAFFYGTAIPLLWWRGQMRLLLGRRHLLGVLAAVGICLAWGTAAIVLAGWSTFYETVSREALLHLSPSRHHRPYPWLETFAHPFRLLAMNLPWSACVVLTLRPGFVQLWDQRGRRLIQALHCWVWPSMLFWTIVPEHSARHSFPLFPGIAGLAAMVVVAWYNAKLRHQGSLFCREHLRARAIFSAMLVWLLIKIVFVQIVVPARNHSREPRLKGDIVASLVPEAEPLYLFGLKDEGIMFYYGRPVKRLADPSQLPSSGEPSYCILVESEWGQWRASPPTQPATVLHWLNDEQGAPIVVVKTQPNSSRQVN